MANLVSLVVVLALAAFSVSGLPKEITKRETQCFSGLNFSPCVCVESKVVTCDHVEKLQGVFSGKKKTDLDTFAVSNTTTLTSLPAAIFGDISFHTFVIASTKVDKIEDGAFQGSEETAETILLNANSFTNFNFKSLRNLKKLSTFELTNDGLKELPGDAFQGLPYLRFISLANNSLTSVPKDFLATLTNLKTINLSGNKLTSLGERAFATPKAASTVSLNLARNEITTIHKDTFQDFKVGVVDLEDNKLVTLKQEVFEPLLDKLNKEVTGLLHTKGNPFKCGKSLQWLVEKPATYKRRVTNFKCDNNKSLTQLKVEDLKQ